MPYIEHWWTLNFIRALHLHLIYSRLHKFLCTPFGPFLSSVFKCISVSDVCCVYHVNNMTYCNMVVVPRNNVQMFTHPPKFTFIDGCQLVYFTENVCKTAMHILQLMSWHQIITLFLFISTALL